MRKFDVKLVFSGSKINAIKCIRAATGLGLKEAKDAAEAEGQFGDGSWKDYVTLRMTGEQAAALFAVVQEETARRAQTTGLGYWKLEIESIQEFKSTNVMDVTSGYAGVKA